jgi:hypothetical protein
MLPLELPVLEGELAPLIALDSALEVLLTPEIVLMNASSKDVRCHRAVGKTHAVMLITMKALPAARVGFLTARGPSDPLKQNPGHGFAPWPVVPINPAA